MTKWKYISTHPNDFRVKRKISAVYGRSRHKPPRRTDNPEPTTDYVRHQNTYYHDWEAWLNLLGSQGWEVCSAGGWGAGGGSDWDRAEILGSEFMVILKREID